MVVVGFELTTIQAIAQSLNYWATTSLFQHPMLLIHTLIQWRFCVGSSPTYKVYRN